MFKGYNKKKAYLLIGLLLYILTCGIYFFTSNSSKNYSIDGVSEYRGGELPDVYRLKSDDFTLEMRNIINAIDNFYALKERKNVEIDKLEEEYLTKAGELESVDQFFELGLELFANLNNPHARFIVPTFGQSMKAELIEGKVVVTTIENKGLKKEIGMEQGAIIKAIDGIAIDEWLKERFKYISSANQHWKWYGAVEEIFLRYIFEDEIRRFKYRNPDGSINKVDISLGLPMYKVRNKLTPKPVIAKSFNDKGYIAVNTLTDGIVEEFDSNLENLLNKDSLILDLRQCGGGSSLNADEIFRRFIQKERRVWAGSSDYERTLKPYEELNYDGDMVILVGPYTFSAAEGLVFDLYDAKRGLFIGEATRGCSGGGPRTFVSEGGFLFGFPTRGVDISASEMEMEGEGFCHQIKLKQSLEDYYNGIDTILEEALVKL
ncbi:S41 family peptidase [Halonatronum saccharophilum]|uniref:S41 family peptidase n=1 Tax=Halonatronum saccharophilum TaxID=150060 RepID=UPI00048A229B|nr:S41 family peptidase [Halonatronum saccharophilum]